MNDKISVIIPTYNRESLICRSVKSVLENTYKNIEVIVVDDGSTDNTSEIIKEINDKRFKYIKLRKNRGACYARNLGIKKSTGKYIAFQDSDDLFHKDKLEKQIKNLIKNNSDLDFCKILIHETNYDAFIPTNELEEKFNKQPFNTLLCSGNFISTQAILAKKEIFNKMQFDTTLPRFQDFDLILRISNKYKISYTNEALVELYRQEDSISRNSDKLKMACANMIAKKYDLTEENRNKLNYTLISIASSHELETSYNNYISILNQYNIIKAMNESLNNEISILKDNNDSLNNELNIIKNNSISLSNELNATKDNNIKLENELNILKEKYNNTNETLNSIINSKRWKLISKLLKAIGK